MAGIKLDAEDMTAIKLDSEADVLEDVLPILDTEFEVGDDTLLPKELYEELVDIDQFKNVSNPVTDPQYDEIKKRLKKLRPELFVAGGKFEGTTASSADFTAAKKIKHNPPMTSIQKADGDLAEKNKILKGWIIDCMGKLGYQGDVHKGEPVFAMSFKRDGVSVRLYYEKGKLVRAGVRPRDGINGADVLGHVRYVKGVPHVLPEPIDCVIGGELEILIDDFEAVNKELAKKGEKQLANPRNATAGAMNPLGDPDVVRQRRVNFIGHSLHMDKPKFSTAVERAKYANKNLKVPFVRVEAFRYDQLAKMEDLVPELLYKVDGAVIEVNNLEDCEQLGQKGGSVTGDPVGKIAWKFSAEHAQAHCNKVRWQPGRTGHQTPVGEFPGVKLSGTTVVQCTLHNLGFVLKHKVGPGAIGDVYKAGEIIPYWNKTLSPAPKVEYPSHCSACNSKLEIEEHEENRKDENGNKYKEKVAGLWCRNVTCPAKLVGTFVHYLSTVGVKGVAESVVNTMIGSGLLKTHADFYKVTPEELEKAGLSQREAVLAYARIHMIDGADQIKDSSALRIRADKAASEKKKFDLAKLIAALGIPGASKGTGRELSDHFRDFDKIASATVAELETVANVGTSTAEAIHGFFADNQSAMQSLLLVVEPLKPKSGKFSNMTFVFTGGQPEGKEYWMEQVQNEGAKVSSSVSKKTHFVVAGVDAGSKLVKAEEMVAKGEFEDTRGNKPKEKHPKGQIIDRAGLQSLLGIVSDDERTF